MTTGTVGGGRVTRIKKIPALEGLVGPGITPMILEQLYARLKRMLNDKNPASWPLSGAVVYVRLDVSADLLLAYQVGRRSDRRVDGRGVPCVETKVPLCGDEVTLRVVETTFPDLVVFFVPKVPVTNKPFPWVPDPEILKNPAAVEKEGGARGEAERKPAARRDFPTPGQISEQAAKARNFLRNKLR